jgi:hypothetical protein
VDIVGDEISEGNEKGDGDEGREDTEMGGRHAHMVALGDSCRCNPAVRGELCCFLSSLGSCDSLLHDIVCISDGVHQIMQSFHSKSCFKLGVWS